VLPDQSTLTPLIVTPLIELLASKTVQKTLNAVAIVGTSISVANFFVSDEPLVDRATQLARKKSRK
jgi:hypothetical protein